MTRLDLCEKNGVGLELECAGLQPRDRGRASERAQSGGDFRAARDWGLVSGTGGVLVEGWKEGRKERKVTHITTDNDYHRSSCKFRLRDAECHSAG